MTTISPSVLLGVIANFRLLDIDDFLDGKASTARPWLVLKLSACWCDFRVWRHGSIVFALLLPARCPTAMVYVRSAVDLPSDYCYLYFI